MERFLSVGILCVLVIVTVFLLRRFPWLYSGKPSGQEPITRWIMQKYNLRLNQAVSRVRTVLMYVVILVFILIWILIL